MHYLKNRLYDENYTLVLDPKNLANWNISFAESTSSIANQRFCIRLCFILCIKTSIKL